MTGSDIASAREALGLNPFAFAAVLGVHVSSVYRWEKAGKNPRVDPLQREIITGIHTHRSSSTAQLKAGKKVRSALESGGSLAGLHTLLQFIIEGDLRG